MRFVHNPFRSQDLLFLAAAFAVTGVYVALASGGFPLDDSWIHQVYARNLAQTGQWAFVPGVPSQASTAPLYTLLLAVGYAVGVDFRLWTHMLGALSLAAAGMIGARLAARVSSSERWLTVVSGLALVLAWHLIWAAASGMETMLFSTLTLAMVALAWRELDDRPPDTREYPLLRGASFGVLAALAAMTRPEAVVLAALAGLLMVIVRPQRSWRTFAGWAWGAGLGFSVAVAPYLAQNLQLTGGLLPDTAAAKQAQNAPIVAGFSLATRLWEMVKPLLAGGQLLLLPGVAACVLVILKQARRDRRAALLLLPLLWAAALVVLYAARLPAPYQHGRYVIPALPGWIILGVVGTTWMLRWGRSSLPGRVLSRSLALAAALAFAYFVAAGAVAYQKDVRIIDEEMVTAARWVAAHVPPEERLAVHDIGALGYFAPRPILDLAGLVSPEIVPFINDADRLWSWLQSQDARYLMAFPDQIPGDDPTDTRLCPVFNTGGATAPAAGGANMVVYRLAWDRLCPG